MAKELKALGLAVKPSKGAFLPEREIKSLAEIDAMEAATRIAEAGMTRGLEILRSARIQKDFTLKHRGLKLTSEILRLEMETAVLQSGGVARGIPSWLVVNTPATRMHVALVPFLLIN